MTEFNCITEDRWGYAATSGQLFSGPNAQEDDGFVRAGGFGSTSPTQPANGALLIATVKRYSFNGTTPPSGTLSGFGATWDLIYHEDATGNGGAAFTEVYRAQQATYTSGFLEYSFPGNAWLFFSSVGYDSFLGTDPAGLSDNGASGIRNVMSHGPTTGSSAAYSQTTPYRDTESLLWSAFWRMSNSGGAQTSDLVLAETYIDNHGSAIIDFTSQRAIVEQIGFFDNAVSTNTWSWFGGQSRTWWACSLELLADPECAPTVGCGELIGSAGTFGKLLSEVSTLTGAATSLTITNATAAIEPGDQIVCFIGLLRRMDEATEPTQMMSVDEGQAWTQSHAMEVFEGSTLRIRASHYDATADQAFAAGAFSITFDFAGRSTRAVAMLACLRGDGIMRCQEALSETDVASFTQAEPGDATFLSWAINFTQTGSGGPLGVPPNGPPDTSNPDLNWNFMSGWSVTDPLGTQKRYDFYGAWTNELTIPLPDPFVDIDWDTTNGSTDIDVCLDAYCCTLAAYWGIHAVAL